MTTDVVPGLIALFFAILLAVLIVALVLIKDFRDAVLGGRGEATIFGIMTVKGVAIVLLCGVLTSGILYSLGKLPEKKAAAAASGPVELRVNVNFDPNDVNPRNPRFAAKAFIKTKNGAEPIDVVPTFTEGGLSLRIRVPDVNTPFFVVVETPKGVWKTDDYSVVEARAVARKLEQE